MLETCILGMKEGCQLQCLLEAQSRGRHASNFVLGTNAASRIRSRKPPKRIPINLLIFAFSYHPELEARNKGSSIRGGRPDHQNPSFHASLDSFGRLWT